MTLNNSTRHRSFDYLRVFAMFLIVFDHLAFMRNHNWFLYKLFDLTLFKPLNIIQSGGALGVCIFFTLSGYFFVNSIKKNESSIVFLTKKLLSLWIPCIFSFIFFYIFQKIIGIITPAGQWWWQYSLKDWILSSTLIATFVGSYDKINITWFLIPLIIFFTYSAFVWKSKLCSKSKLCISMIIVLLMYSLGKILCQYSFFYTLGDRSWFITVIISGVIFNLINNKDISHKEGIFFLLINYLITFIGMYLYAKNYLYDEKYLISYIYAILIFVTFNKIELKYNLIIDYFSTISFSVYLTHMTFGSLIISLFEQLLPNCPYMIALTVSLIISLFAANILHFVVEKPLKGIIRRF